MRVYYFTSHKIAVEHILPEMRMKLSQFHELNDPFELQPYSLGNKELRHVIRALKSDYFGKKGVLCFSDNWHSPVMWAHYAEKHAGICLGFDIPERKGELLVNPVVYNPSRLEFLLDTSKDMHGIDQQFVQSLLYTKSHEWQYEREYRAIANLQIRDSETGFFYVDFGPEMQLREVVIGTRNPTPIGQIAKAVRRGAHQVSVFKVRPAFHKFAMVRNMAIAAISVRAAR
jgi:hypothetical protein